MKIPLTILTKIDQIDILRRRQNTLSKEVLDWFESKGIDTSEEGFTDVVYSKILYGEFTIEAWEDYLNGRKE